jgi:hypothetical protein
MLNARHEGQRYKVSSFSTAGGLSDIELASKAYRKVNGWAEELGGNLSGFSPEEVLDLIDRIRIPLAEKRFDGKPLSAREEIYLSMMDSLTDKLLNSLAPMPEEPADVKSALVYAKRLINAR